jgi:hypothetical protein
MSVSRETDLGGETHRRVRNDGRNSSAVADGPARGPPAEIREGASRCKKGYTFVEANGTIGNYLRPNYLDWAA